MTRIAIVGGALQGMEAVLLSKAAGYETVVLDRKPGAPALLLAGIRFIMLRTCLVHLMIAGWLFQPTP